MKTATPSAAAPSAPPQLVPVPEAIAAAIKPPAPPVNPLVAPIGQPDATQIIGRPPGRLSVERSHDLATKAGASVPGRNFGALFTEPSPSELVVNQRVAGARSLLSALISAADRSAAQVKTMIGEITKYSGGEAIAAASGFQCSEASKFIDELDALLDRYAPKRD